jgi:hypothetical protein
MSTDAWRRCGCSGSAKAGLMMVSCISRWEKVRLWVICWRHSQVIIRSHIFLVNHTDFLVTVLTDQFDLSGVFVFTFTAVVLNFVCILCVYLYFSLTTRLGRAGKKKVLMDCSTKLTHYQSGFMSRLLNALTLPCESIPLLPSHS